MPTSTNISLIPTRQPARCERHSPAMWTVSYCILLATAAKAIDVYLSPAPLLRSSNLAVDTANLAISHHLGFESAEPLGLNEDIFGDLLTEQAFVGKGQNDGLVLTIDEQDAKGA